MKEGKEPVWKNKNQYQSIINALLLHTCFPDNPELLNRRRLIITV